MADRPVVTRFAPSPTGFLHIGGARTALFNWLFARGRGGKFLLRIEDTDRKRYTPAAVDAILEGLKWLGLDWDEDAISQFERADRHREVAMQLLETGHAYKCFATQEEIAAFREEASANKKSTLFQSPWRDADPETYPDAPFAVRLKTPQSGKTEIADEVQGVVAWKNDTLDDLILLRSDGSPTYMLAVVVDDFDMGVSHVIRGDDHLTNTARQALIYRALGWEEPVWAHIPLIHGPDGAKLSKRHGALGVEAYRDMGYPAAAMRNYLARLGWSHGDDEFFTTEQATEWFGFDGIGKSPARFDFKKLANLSGQHIRASSDETLMLALRNLFAAEQNKLPQGEKLDQFISALSLLKERAKTLPELLEIAYFITAERPLSIEDKAAKNLDPVSRGMLKELTSRLRNANWSADALEEDIKTFAEAEGLKLGKVAQPLRTALTGRAVSPGFIDVMMLLGPEETIARLEDQID